LALTPAQAHELREHLGSVLKVNDLDWAVAAIDMAASICFRGGAESYQRAEALRRAESYLREQEASDRERHEHSRAVAEHADALVALLSGERPAWAALIEPLRGVAQQAGIEADAYRPQAGAGRRADRWRDDLIATIYSVYPADTAKKTADSHFEQTVELVLGYIGREIENVHGLILAALNRTPDPPFYVGMLKQR
jgi:hypothetical protein